MLYTHIYVPYDDVIYVGEYQVSWTQNWCRSADCLGLGCVKSGDVQCSDIMSWYVCVCVCVCVCIMCEKLCEQWGRAVLGHYVVV